MRGKHKTCLADAEEPPRTLNGKSGIRPHPAKKINR